MNETKRKLIQINHINIRDYRNEIQKRRLRIEESLKTIANEKEMIAMCQRHIAELDVEDNVMISQALNIGANRLMASR